MKNLKKINALVTVIGVVMFVIGTALQLINIREERDIIIGLGELTYFGFIVLLFSLIVWLIVLDIHVFKDWNWFNSTTKADDILALSMFIVIVPILMSLSVYTIYELVNWYDWYTVENYYEPLYGLVNSSLRKLEEEMVFWVILITLISTSSGMAIFLYKAKTKK